MFNSALSSVCTTSDHFKVIPSEEHVLPLHDLNMLNSAVQGIVIDHCMVRRGRVSTHTISHESHEVLVKPAGLESCLYKHLPLNFTCIAWARPHTPQPHDAVHNYNTRSVYPRFRACTEL